MNKKYLGRNIDRELQEWKDSRIRKPLLLRGARQAGKSSTVREFGRQFDYFPEINFEKKQFQDANHWQIKECVESLELAACRYYLPRDAHIGQRSASGCRNEREAPEIPDFRHGNISTFPAPGFGATSYSRTFGAGE